MKGRGTMMRVMLVIGMVVLGSGCVSKTMLKHEVGEAYAKGERAGMDKVAAVCNESLDAMKARARECEMRLAVCYEGDREK